MLGCAASMPVKNEEKDSSYFIECVSRNESLEISLHDLLAMWTFFSTKFTCHLTLSCYFVLIQSDREKSEGLPVAPFMDRDKVTKPTAQIGFIKFVLIPMFETVMKVSKSCWNTAQKVNSI